MSKNLSQTAKEQIKELTIQTIKQEKPQTAKPLIASMQLHHAKPPEQTTNLPVELENEDHLHFIGQESSKPSSAKEYVFSKPAAWYWTTILLASVTAIAMFTITGNDNPLVYFRYLLGVIFILFLPGFTVAKTLFPTEVPPKTSSKKMDTIERLALDFGVSLALVPMVGLVLNFTPWGIRLMPLTISLLALDLAFATAAIIRDAKTKSDQTRQS